MGTDSTGTFDKGNDATGLLIFDADNNQIGGTAANQRNLISGNGSYQKRRAGISVTAGNSNVFQGNIVGLNSLGTGKLPSFTVVYLVGANNAFGGDAAGAGNTVSGDGEVRPANDSSPGCDGTGMSIPRGINLATDELLTLDNTLKGNRFGTNPAGTQDFGNCWAAIGTLPSTKTIIGSIAQSGRNVVSDNGLDAISRADYNFNNADDGRLLRDCGQQHRHGHHQHDRSAERLAQPARRFCVCHRND